MMLVFVAMLSGVTKPVLRENLKFVDVVSGEQHPLNLNLIEVWKNLSAQNELGMDIMTFLWLLHFFQQHETRSTILAPTSIFMCKIDFYSFFFVPLEHQLSFRNADSCIHLIYKHHQKRAQTLKAGQSLPFGSKK